MCDGDLSFALVEILAATEVSASRLVQFSIENCRHCKSSLCEFIKHYKVQELSKMSCRKSWTSLGFQCPEKINHIRGKSH